MIVIYVSGIKLQKLFVCAATLSNKGGLVEERLYKKTTQYRKFEFSLSKTES